MTATMTFISRVCHGDSAPNPVAVKASMTNCTERYSGMDSPSNVSRPHW
jgi:hypothetical protein